MSLASRLEIKDSWQHTNALDNSTTEDASRIKHELALANGTGNNQVNQNWHDTRTVATGANDDLDLAGVLTNAFGATITLTKIKKITIINNGAVIAAVNTPTAGEDLLLGGAAANPVTSLFDGSSTAVLPLKSGGALVITAPLDGYTVTPGSADVLRIANDGLGVNDISYTIHIEGVE